jgi:hypothetical protein
MFGQGLPLGVADFCDGVVVIDELDELDVLGVLGVVAACVAGAALVVLVVVVGAAEALAMPAAAPPVASAPATMVAPSILEMVIGSNLLGWIDGVWSHRARPGEGAAHAVVGVV